MTVSNHPRKLEHDEGMKILRSCLTNDRQEFVNGFNAIKASCWMTTEAKGFHQAQVEAGTRIALMHSELSEALEALRKPDLKGKLEDHSLLEEELADVIIRIMDFAHTEGLDVAGALVVKAIYNTRREPMHGGKAF